MSYIMFVHEMLLILTVASDKIYGNKDVCLKFNFLWNFYLLMDDKCNLLW